MILKNKYKADCHSYNIFLHSTGQYQGSIRLWHNGATSPSYTYGRVQIYYNGQWGDICGHVTDSPFHQEEADVVCRNLGYVGAYSFTRAAEDKYVFTVINSWKF